MVLKVQHTAAEVARYLLWRIAQERPEDPDYLTNLKLQKLLYYVQGWHLAETGRPAFADEIQAWREGPVVPSVYQVYRALGKRPIVDVPEDAPQLDEQVRAVVESVWQRYKNYSAFHLSDLTHDESPWQAARGDLPATAQSNAPITLGQLSAEFAGRVGQAQERLNARATNIRAAARSLTRRTAPGVYAPAPEQP